MTSCLMCFISGFPLMRMKKNSFNFMRNLTLPVKTILVYVRDFCLTGADSAH